MPTTSLLPTVLDALTTACRADATLTAAEVDVVDGPIASELSVFHRLYVGSSDFADEPGAVTEDRAGEVLPEFLYSEAMNVTCTAEEWRGSSDVTDVPELRVLAYQTVDAVRRLVGGPQPLGIEGLQHARIINTRYEPRQTTETVSVSVVFTIEFQLRVTTVG
jgi:hypothetical protein